jgi:hypothetical protein
MIRASMIREGRLPRLSGAGIKAITCTPAMPGFLRSFTMGSSLAALPFILISSAPGLRHTFRKNVSNWCHCRSIGAASGFSTLFLTRLTMTGSCCAISRPARDRLSAEASNIMWSPYGFCQMSLSARHGLIRAAVAPIRVPEPGFPFSTWIANLIGCKKSPDR